jgi:superfamily II DNA or RNA helicase
MRSSNCGINLTSANRVFLLEPSMNPAAVQQAIGRVHRLGQKRKVEIIRMIVKDSIETRLTRMLDKRYTNETSASDENEVDLVASTPSESFVGSLSSDRTEVLTKEFDLLFGVEPDGSGEECEATESEGVPDAVMSSANGEGDDSATSGTI